jgi:XTP/dITP diphosphohydrolase
LGVAARLCSHNEHKARELRALLPGWTIELLEAGEFPAEDGATYYENARAKALFGRTVGPADAWMLGEDAGIEVVGLGGGPGVRSARSAAGDEVPWMLRELHGIEGDGRRARYVSELVAIAPDGNEFGGTGTLAGRIIDEPRGTEGFGFDPIFLPDDEEQTVAELGDGWKSKHSHRARAAAELRKKLVEAGIG